MILAGDVGATKTLVGLFEQTATGLTPLHLESYPTTEFDGLPSIVRAFLATQPETPAIEAASFGVAGPVIDQRARMTNVPWGVAADEIAAAFGIRRVRLFNDLEAMAHGVPVLRPDELHTLQAGEARPEGNAVLIAAGTGMGQSILHRVDGRWRPIPTEGGHVDFAARTDREWELVRYLRATHGRVDLEHVVSGIGLLNLAHFVHGGETCPVVGSLAASEHDAPARISAAAMNRSCPLCIETMELFVSAYGAAAGNLAVQGVASAGVYIGGGIAPKILPLMQDRRFLDAFVDKGPLHEFLTRVPVHVILNKMVGILGAAVGIVELLERRT